MENFERKLSFNRQTLGSHSEFCLLVQFAANYLHVAEAGPNFHIPIPIPCRLILCICVVYQRIVSLARWTRNRYLALRQAFTVCLLRRCGSFLFALTCGLCRRAKLGALHIRKGGGGTTFKEFQSALTTFLMLTHTAQL